jgi:hypothetical protein
MNPLNDDLARAVVEARLATARQRQLARRAKSTRDTSSRVVPSRWWGRLFRRGDVAETAPRQTATPLGRLRLESILDRTAERIVESGTLTESATLCAMSAATRHLSPGAAAALVDWDGAEAARLRAFSILHGVVLRELGVGDRSRLLAELTRPARRETHTGTAVQPACVTSASRRTASRRAEGPADGSRGEAA